MRDLTSVIPIPEEQAKQIAGVSKEEVNPQPAASAPTGHQVDDSDKTVILPSCLALRHRGSGRELSIRDGDILGRHNVGKEIFDSMPGVSRRHLQIHFRNGAWQVEDLGSTNGTTLDGSVLQKGRSYGLSSRNVIRLADVCDLEVL